MHITKLQVCFISVIIVTAFSTWYLVPGSWNEDGQMSKYFFSSNQSETGFIVHTRKCRIPNLSIWSEDVRPFFQRRYERFPCKEERRPGTIHGLTFVRKEAILVNESMVNEKGWTLDMIDCCYRTIERVQQSYTNYTKSADNNFRFSEACYSMTSVKTIPYSGFTKVTCTLKARYLWSWDKLIHTDFHLLASFRNTSRNITGKLTFWNNSSTSKSPRTRPPNVLLLGIDSTSRMNFRRFMPKTLDLLENRFGSVGMGGYTKVGLNTYPNFVPLFSSFSADELAQICHQTPETSFNQCPFLWKHFSAANYMTAHIEDEPAFAIFNYMKTGFVLPPVDIYPRPWMLALYEYRKMAGFPQSRCVDSGREDQIILRYIVDLVEMAEEQGLPYFFSTWLTGLTHNEMDSLQVLDSDMHKALITLHERGHLNNTVLLVMGDHGYRFLPIRKTKSGWYEDKLPALWIALPKTLKELKPTWVDALRYNSKQLATPFDVHQMLKDILNLNNNIEVETDKTTAVTPTSKSRHGISLFKKLRERSCDEAGVPVEYCACEALLEYTGNKSVIRVASEAVVGKINSGLPSPLCTRLIVGRVEVVGVSKDGGRIVIRIDCAPEDIQVEAVIGYNATLYKWDVVDILRTNQMRPCASVNEPHLYCQCSMTHANASRIVKA